MAIKSLDIDKAIKEEQVDHVLQEGEVIQDLNHPFVVGFGPIIF